MTLQRVPVLKKGCPKKPTPVPEKKTEVKGGVLMVMKSSDPGATMADIPYSGGIPSMQTTKLISVKNITKYQMTFLSAFNPSPPAAKCSTIGTPIITLFNLAPGQIKTFAKPSLFTGKIFNTCTNSNGESSLKLSYTYEITQ